MVTTTDYLTLRYYAIIITFSFFNLLLTTIARKTT